MYKQSRFTPSRGKTSCWKLITLNVFFFNISPVISTGTDALPEVVESIAIPDNDLPLKNLRYQSSIGITLATHSLLILGFMLTHNESPWLVFRRPKAIARLPASGYGH